MADVGVVLVGSALPHWSADGVPVRRIDGVPPRPTDRAALTAAAKAVFTGADADRWGVVPEAHLQRHGHLLWVAQAVHAHQFDAWGAGVERALVVAWVDEPALVPSVRQVLRSGVPCGVLLLGDSTHRDLARVHATHTVLGQLLRDQQVLRVWTVSERVPSLDVWVPIGMAMLARAKTTALPPPVELDPGPWLGLPSTPLFGAPAVEFDGLEQVPVGRTSSLERAARLVCAHDVLLQLCEATPGFRPEAPRPELAPIPSIDAADALGDAVRTALAEVEFRGEELLVDQIDRRMRPVVAEVDRLCGIVADAERARLSGLQAFTAYGIFRTVEGLREELAAIDQLYPAEHLRGIALLLDGSPDILDEAPSGSMAAWRRAFRGVPSEVFSRHEAGERLARRLVREQFAQFRTGFAAQLSAHLHALLQRAHDTEAPPSSVELGLLLQRAERVRDAVMVVARNLLERARSEGEAAIRTDVLVRTLTRDPNALVDVLRRVRVGESELRARFTDALRRFRDGPIDAAEFEAKLQRLVEMLHEVPERGEARSYGEVVRGLVEDADPARFRTLVTSGADGVALMGRDLASTPELSEWMAKAGFSAWPVDDAHTTLVVVRPLPGRRGPAVGRTATSEHRIADLLLPDPGGDSVAALIGLARSVTALVAGVAVGVVQLRVLGAGDAWEVTGTGLEDSVPPVLPFDAVRRLATRDEPREALERTIQAELRRLPEPAVARVVAAVTGLVRRGFPVRMRAQLGLDARYARVLDTLVGPLLSSVVEPAASRVRAVAAPAAAWVDLTASPRGAST